MLFATSFCQDKISSPIMPGQVKSSHIYLYSAFHNTDCIKAASQ